MILIFSGFYRIYNEVYFRKYVYFYIVIDLIFVIIEY